MAQIEESLDPKDWENVSKVAHSMVDDMILYLKPVDVHSGEGWFSDNGLQLSHCFPSLKALMSFCEPRIKKYNRLINQNIELTNYLCKKANEIPELEILAPYPMNIVCFRDQGTMERK